MKIKIEQLLEKKAIFDKILAKELPFKLSYRLIKLASKITQEMKHINSTRDDMIKRYGVAGENDSYSVPKDKINEFTKEWKSFIAESIEFSVEKIPEEALEKIELSAYDIANISDFISLEKENIV